MQEDFRQPELIRIVHMLHSVTKIDIHLYDENGSLKFQLMHHSIPIVLNQLVTEHVTHIHEVLRKNESKHYYRFTDPYGLDYMAAGVWNKTVFEGSIIIGPMISSLSVIDWIQDIIAKNNLPAETRRPLEQFYQSLPITNDAERKDIGELLVHLCMHRLIHAEPITAETTPPPLKAKLQKFVLEENAHLIEKRYEHQNILMDAIMKGDQAKANQELNLMLNELASFSNRVPGNPMRASKNIGFVLNTMCRIAAERSGVHPVYLHNLSERFAIQIERTTNLPNFTNLAISMINEYCQLVASVSSGQYSHVVKKAMDYILLNLGSHLTLQLVAGHIHVNPSHLSRKFKEETSETITEFINRKRVEEAKLYLRRSKISVTDVAFMVGFNDMNYFSKVFKKYTSMTPSQFAKR